MGENHKELDVKAIVIIRHSYCVDVIIYPGPKSHAGSANFVGIRGQEAHEVKCSLLPGAYLVLSWNRGDSRRQSCRPSLIEVMPLYSGLLT